MKLFAQLSLLVTAFFTQAAMAAPTLNWNAYYEGYYLYNMNSPETATGTAENTGRLNDSIHNSLTTNLVELGFNGQASNEVNYVVEAAYGDVNDTVYGDNSNRDILNQAYLSFNLPALNGITFDLGRFYSHMGHETLKAAGNWNFSHSLTYLYAIPKWHEGARVHVINRKNFGVSAFVYNGWNEEDDENDSKTLGARVRYTPSEKFDLNYNLITGPEQGTNESNHRTVQNVFAKFGISAPLSVIAQATFGTEKRASLGNGGTASSDWYTLSGTAKYDINNRSFVSGRLEHMNDENGSRSQTAGGQDVKVTSLTGTYGVAHGEGLQTWFEARFDSADEDVFRDGSNDFEDSQISLLASLMYQL